MLTLTPQSGMMMVMLCQLYSGAQKDPLETQHLEEHQQRQMSTISHAGVYTDLPAHAYKAGVEQQKLCMCICCCCSASHAPSAMLRRLSL